MTLIQMPKLQGFVKQKVVNKIKFCKFVPGCVIKVSPVKLSAAECCVKL